MSFNHSIRIVKKIDGRTVSGLRLSKLSARSDNQRCVVYNKALTDYGDVENHFEDFNSPSLSIRKIGKSMEIVSESCGGFFEFLSKLPFYDANVIDFADAYNEFFANEKFVIQNGDDSNQDVDKIAESHGVVAEVVHIAKEKDTIILYINIHERGAEMPQSEEVIFGIFDDMAKKYNLGVIYDGFEEVIDEQKI